MCYSNGSNKRTATKPVAVTHDSTPPERWNLYSGMIAVFCMITYFYAMSFCSYMNIIFLTSGKQYLWAQKMPNFVDWTNNRFVRTGLNYTSIMYYSTAKMGINFEKTTKNRNICFLFWLFLYS